MHDQFMNNAKSYNEIGKNYRFNYAKSKLKYAKSYNQDKVKVH